MSSSNQNISQHCPSMSKEVKPGKHLRAAKVWRWPLIPEHLVAAVSRAFRKEKTNMKPGPFFTRAMALTLSVVMAAGVGLTPLPAMAQAGTVLQTPAQPMELPVEIEVETGPGSLKQVPLWKEIIQMLRDPYLVPLTGSATTFDGGQTPAVPVNTGVIRRPGFGVAMPPLQAWSLDYNFLTGQPLRLRTSDGEISWDQPGPLHDPTEIVPVDAFNVPLATRTIIGELVVDGNNNLVVSNPTANPNIPPNGTIVAVPAVQDGVLHELEGGELEEVEELEIPVNEEDFFRPTTDTAGVPGPLRPLIGRPAAEILGKALFWDMQVGSDGIQACGSCHFHGGVDNRTRNQRNPNTTGPAGNLATLEALPASNTTAFNSDVLAGDFPFHNAAQDVTTTPNDVMSSMGVSRFKTFNDIPTPGGGPGSAAFIQVAGVPGNVRPLAPDIGTVAPDLVPVNEGFRRVEPRNTPTFHGAAFNFDTFWDARARFEFNGGSVFGLADPTPHIFLNQGGALVGATNGMIKGDPETHGADQPVRIKFSSLASQAVGPPLSNFEMSFDGRNWAKIGKKLLQTGVTPLANQLVSPTDSVLGPASNQRNNFGGNINQVTLPKAHQIIIPFRRFFPGKRGNNF
jgi:hypothetical protein